MTSGPAAGSTYKILHYFDLQFTQIQSQIHILHRRGSFVAGEGDSGKFARRGVESPRAARDDNETRPLHQC